MRSESSEADAVIRVVRQQAHPATLENASVGQDISEFARFVAADIAASAGLKEPKT